MPRFRLNYANVVSTLALFLALGGTSYAIARNSVGERELKDGAVSSRKIRDGSIQTGDLASGALVSGARGPRGPVGPPGPLLGAGGDLEGEFPNPRVRAGAVGADELANPYVFRARKVASQDTPANGPTQVLLGAEDFDPHGDFDPGTSKYTIPVKGIYQFSGSTSTCCGGGRMFIEIATSRPERVIRGSDYTLPGIHQSVASGLLSLERGDTVQLNVWTSAVNTMGPSVVTFLSGFLVAPS